MNRLGIFVFYDKDGVVDRYVEYLLTDMMENLNELIVVCNGNLSDEGRGKLEQFTHRIHIRENAGFDAMAYKLALGTYCSWNEIRGYEEVVLFNDTFFGPIYPFREMFAEMSGRGLDFWGITYSKEMSFLRGKESVRKVFPTHVQYYFVVITKNLLRSTAFQEYWDEFDSTRMTFSDVIVHNEMKFTRHFSDLGFHWGAYVDSSPYESDNPEKNFNHYGAIAYELIKDFRCPIMKRKNFISKELSVRTGNAAEDCAKALAYIDQYTEYDADMIWENILRVYPIGEIKDALHLESIVSSRKLADLDPRVDGSRVTVAAFLDDKRCLSLLEEKWLLLPASYRKIVLCTESIDPSLPGAECHLVGGAGGWLPAMLRICRDALASSDFFCFVHGGTDANIHGPATIGHTGWTSVLSAMLHNANHVENVLDLFLKNPRLGLLVPPQPLHGPYFGCLGSEWGDSLIAVRRLAVGMGLNVPISDASPCRFHAKSFWCRPQAFRGLLEYHWDNDADDAAVEKFIPLAVQNQGYYSAIALSDELSSVMVDNLYFMLSGIVAFQQKRFSFSDYSSYFTSALSDYCRHKSQIYVYGAGLYGERIAETLIGNGENVCGFIVSDGQPNPGTRIGRPVRYLSEIDPMDKGIGIVVAMMARSRAQVVPILRKMGLDSIVV